MSTAEQNKQLLKLKLNKNDDQDTLRYEIEQVEISFTGIVQKSLNITAAVNTAGTYYLGVIQNVTKEKKEKSETVTFEGLIGAMNKEW